MICRQCCCCCISLRAVFLINFGISFLEGRSQQVKLDGNLSSVMPCPAGVSQGSVMSPTLFNVHINDLEDSVPDSLVVDTWKYADDCTQDESVQLGATSHMQEVLDAMHTWADKNKMILNSKKTKDMWIYFGNRIPEPPPPPPPLPYDSDWWRDDGKSKLLQAARCLASEQPEMEHSH